MQLLKDAFSILFIHKISSCNHRKEDVGQYRPCRPSQAKSKKCWLEPKWLRTGHCAMMIGMFHPFALVLKLSVGFVSTARGPCHLPCPIANARDQ